MNTYYKIRSRVGHFHINTYVYVSHNRLISLTQINGLNTEQSLFMEIYPKHTIALVKYCCILYGQWIDRDTANEWNT